MFHLHNLLNKFVKWVNSIGEPKKPNLTQSTEVISAIKVKNNQAPANSAASTTFADTETKQPYGKSGVAGKSGTGGKTGTPGKSNPLTNNSTSARGYYPQYAINTFEKMDEVFNEMDDVFVKIDKDLERLLSGGSNIAPTDITQMYKSKKIKK
jgi:hypothetical protein